MLLRLQPYDLTITYKPGAEDAIADALSRLSADEKHGIDDLELVIHEVSSQFSSELLERIRGATEEDSTLTALKQTVFTG